MAIGSINGYSNCMPTAQCEIFRHEFKSQNFLEQHVCSGLMVYHDVLNIDMRLANQLLINMDFSIAGAISVAVGIRVWDPD